MTMYLIKLDNENKYIANTNGIMQYAEKNFNVENKDIDEVISTLDENGIIVEELNFDIRPLLKV